MRNLLIATLLLSTAGCSWLFHDRSNDYLQAEQKPVITVPDDVASVSLQPRLPIPDVQSKSVAEGEFELPRPKPLEIQASETESASLKEVQAENLATELVRDGNGTPVLRLNIEFARAWSELGEALRKADIVITDLNRSIGTYYITIEKPDETIEPGFWAGLFGAEPEVATEALEVKLNRARSGVYIAIHESQDSLADEQTAQQLLKQIQDNVQ